MVLHTWTRKLEFHPHVHALVTAGGLQLDGNKWSATSDKYLFPVEALRFVFRAKMLAALGALHAERRFARFEAFLDPEGFDRLMRCVAAKTWVVYAKKPFRQVGHVLRYLGRYTHRVAIANSRLVDVTHSSVSFRTKEGKLTTLESVEFLRRFVQHVLPDGFHKIRHYGLYSATGTKQKLELAREHLLPKPATSLFIPPRLTGLVSWSERLRELTGRDVSRCPTCNATLQHLPLPRQQAPPFRTVA
jgi:hypothetical protein